ncbi:MAG: molybdopterin dinucleotide binding domain-containing protein [Methanoregulaceae archaeon]|nr:molybdopterin dinucleotide binding domain-containing protein [Methanoregulaceae archaeon]
MRFLLNTGRTITQGSNVEDKNSEAYREEASTCRMNPVDMMELDIEERAPIVVRSAHGEIVMQAIPDAGQARGEVFVCLGPYANHIVSPETHCTGMPDFKATVVDIEPTTEGVWPVWKLMESVGGCRYED